MNLDVIQGIPLLGPLVGKLVNDHLAKQSFLTISKDQTSWTHTMECLDTFYLASWSSIQWLKYNDIDKVKNLYQAS